jgi:hypothetical protein
MITNKSKLLASKKAGVWKYINKEIYEMFDDEGNCYLESEMIEDEIFLYESSELDSNYCLNRNEIRTQ